MKTVFFGSSKHILPTIKTLQNNFDLGLVITTEKSPTDAVPVFCERNNIPHLSVHDLRDEDVVGKIKAVNAEVAVLGYFGLIVPQELLSIFPKGIINIHPSLLPLYRGPTPVQSAIFSGDSETGVSIILLDSDVDHGPVFIQKTENILPSDTTESLHARLFSIGAELVKDILPKYLSGEITPFEQNHNTATFTKELSKSDGQFDINNPPSKDKLDRIIRAYFPWPTAWTIVRIKNKELRIKLLPASLSLRGESEANDVAISSNFLLQVEGGKPMSVKDFLNGYPGMQEIIKNLFS